VQFRGHDPVIFLHPVAFQDERIELVVIDEVHRAVHVSVQRGRVDDRNAVERQDAVELIQVGTRFSFALRARSP